MPDYLINSDGAVKEWSWPDLEDNYAHRHCSHLYALFDGVPADIGANPELINGFKRAIEMKMEWRRQEKEREMAFGLALLGMAATSLRDVKTAYEIVAWLANDYWLPSLNPTHDPKNIFNVDICGGLPAVVIKMLLYSQSGLIDLLPALPKEWPRGKVEGLPCRGQALVKSLAWDGKTITAILRSVKEQQVIIRVPGEISAISVEKSAPARTTPDEAKDQRLIALPANTDVIIHIELK